MKNIKKQKNSSGFTLLELLLGITISVVIFLATSSLLAVLYNTDSKTQRIQTLEQAKNDLQQDISTSVRWAKDIEIAEKTLTTDTAVYALKDDDRLYKNDAPLTSNEILVKSFEIKDLSGSAKLKSLEITLRMAHKRFASTNEILRLVVSQRLQDLTGADLTSEGATPPAATQTPTATVKPGAIATAKPSKSPTAKPTASPTIKPGR